MKPTIAIDVDGVLTDTYPTWRRAFSRQLCGRQHVVDAPPFETLTWNSWEELCSVCFKRCLFDADVLYAHKVRDGVDEALSKLARIADLQVVTTRPDPEGKVTTNWLFWKDLLKYFSAVHVSTNKREVCESIGAVALIDDAPTNIEKLYGSVVTPVIYDMPYNQDCRGPRVFNWYGAYNMLAGQALAARLRER